MKRVSALAQCPGGRYIIVKRRITMQKRISSAFLAFLMSLSLVLHTLSGTVYAQEKETSNAVKNPAYAAAISNDTLEGLLNEYFQNVLTHGVADYDCDFDDFLIWMSEETLENAIIRVESLSEAEIAIDSVSFTITSRDEGSGKLTIDVTETADGKSFSTQHSLKVSGGEGSWKIESDNYIDAVTESPFVDMDSIGLFPTVGAAPSAPQTHPNTWSNTGNQAQDIVQVALTQLGYSESGKNHTKYNVWFYDRNKSAAWCAIFISWCANQAGIPKSIIKPNALASWSKVSTMKKNLYGTPAYAFGETKAKVGDIAYIDNDRDGVTNHVGLVYKVDDTAIYTIEGNFSNRVSKCQFSASNGRDGNRSILFFARPKYEGGDITQTQFLPIPSPGTVPPDVYPTDYYYNAFDWAVQKQVVIYYNQNFNPGNPCNRASAVQFLWRLAGAPSSSSWNNPFTDVVPEDNYYTAVLWAVERGITNGVEKDKFKPTDTCNRGQIVTFLHRYAGKPSTSNASRFPDVPIGSFCYDSVSWASSLGVTQGYGDGTFHPTDKCSRANIITFLSRYAANS